MTQDNVMQLHKAKALLLNSAPLFTIFDKEGKQKPWIKRGFLSSKWLSRKDIDRGWLEMDGKPYDLMVSQALYYAASDLADNDRVRAICSFQEHEGGKLLVVAKLLTREPYVLVRD